MQSPSTSASYWRRRLHPGPAGNRGARASSARDTSRGSSGGSCPSISVARSTAGRKRYGAGGVPIVRSISAFERAAARRLESGSSVQLRERSGVKRARAHAADSELHETRLQPRSRSVRERHGEDLARLERAYHATVAIRRVIVVVLHDPARRGCTRAAGRPRQRGAVPGQALEDERDIHASTLVRRRDGATKITRESRDRTVSDLNFVETAPDEGAWSRRPERAPSLEHHRRKPRDQLQRLARRKPGAHSSSTSSSSQSRVDRRGVAR